MVFKKSNVVYSFNFTKKTITIKNILFNKWNIEKKYWVNAFVLKTLATLKNSLFNEWTAKDKVQVNNLIDWIIDTAKNKSINDDHEKLFNEYKDNRESLANINVFSDVKNKIVL